TTLGAAGMRDLLVAALDSDGKVLELGSFGGEADEYPTAIAAAPGTGRIAVVGMYGEGEAALGDATLPAPASGYNLFAASYVSGPEPRWSLHGTATDGLFPHHVLSMSGDGELAFAGEYRSMMRLGTLTAVDVGGRDLFFARVSPTGTAVALVGYADSGDQIGMGAVYDGLGDLYLVGTSNSPFTIDEFGIAGDAATDLFVAKVDESGTNATWAIASDGGPVGGLRAALAVDGSLVLAGRFEGSLALPGAPVLDASGGSDVFVARILSGGDLAWIRALGGNGDDEPGGVAVGPDGKIAITGSFRGTVTPDDGHEALVSAGGSDVFLLVLAGNSGETLRAVAFGGVEDDRGESVAFAGAGRIALGVTYRGEVDFGGPEPLTGDADGSGAVIGVR
ncbi:MAG TPA: hypothetical protein VFU21_19840, partial [Kofleriaceae bacterium]|nr:hypothetical protein [Kofleriaceae bacterium]